MTTVTDAMPQRLLAAGKEGLASEDLESILSQRLVARWFAEEVRQSANRLVPSRRWTLEDVRDVLEAAIDSEREPDVRILEGRYFRKRLREQCDLADRYGDPFCCVVFHLGPERSTAAYASVLDAIVERLRRSDMVFMYRRRLALILPRMQLSDLGPLMARLMRLVGMGAGTEAIIGHSHLEYPKPGRSARQVLDWAEDQLR